jgi:hypothetical protein
LNIPPIDLASVHWENGMTVTDEHFRHQEHYFESSILWLLHYGSASFGLVGSGPRLAEGQSRPTVCDPEVTALGDSKSCVIAVSSCRGITLGGAIVNLSADPTRDPPSLRVNPAEISGSETVYVVAMPHQKVAYETDQADFDGQPRAERRQVYELALVPTPER